MEVSLRKEVSVGNQRRERMEKRMHFWFLPPVTHLGQEGCAKVGPSAQKGTFWVLSSPQTFDEKQSGSRTERKFNFTDSSYTAWRLDLPRVTSGHSMVYMTALETNAHCLSSNFRVFFLHLLVFYLECHLSCYNPTKWCWSSNHSDNCLAKMKTLYYKYLCNEF